MILITRKKYANEELEVLHETAKAGVLEVEAYVPAILKGEWGGI